jgi:hypothetical protein
MDDDSKQILVLKLVVGFLVLLAIIIFIVIIVSVRNANKKTSGGETTTRRTISGEVIEDTTSTSWFSEETTTSSETTSTITTTTTTQAPVTQAPTTKKPSGGGSSKPSSGGGSSSGGGGSSNIPSNTYTVIGSNDPTSYHNADNTMEWALVNKINQNTNNKYKVALELRTVAERLAEVCCEAPGSCKIGVDDFVANNEEYAFTRKVYVDMTSNHTVDRYYNNLVNNELLHGNGSYIGVGFYKATNQISCAAWVVDGE